MKPTLRFQSQLLVRRSYKPARTLRIRFTPGPKIVFRPVNQFGTKPQLIHVP